MKTVLVLVCALAVVTAKPPRFTQFQRQMAPPVEAAPYPPSGWKPPGPEFPLPEPAPSYGPPPSEYGPPSNSYGAPVTPPPPEYGPPDLTTDEVSTVETETAEPDSENVQGVANKQGRFVQQQRLRQQNQFLVVPKKQSLILLDDSSSSRSLQQGRLSRVQILDRDNFGGAVLRSAYVQIYQ